MRHRLVKGSAELLGNLFGTLARVVLTTSVFTVCLVFALRYLGIPIPGPFELVHGFEELSKLAKI